MWKGQAPQGLNGERIELHHISSKNPDLHDKITKQLDFFVTERFHRDKAQAERTINFVRPIGKTCTGLYWKL